MPIAASALGALSKHGEQEERVIKPMKTQGPYFCEVSSGCVV
jgi:hypothetical protein